MFCRHDMLVMISGGSGITPFISIIRELVFLNSTQKCKIPKLLLITSFKNSSHLSMLELLLPISSILPSQSSNLDLQIEAYITREKSHPIEKTLPPKTIVFKTNPLDKPISSILGPKNWLWLAAIISSSFVIFLLLLGIITRYYIYPMDLNMMKIEYMTRRNLIYIGLICFAIGISSTLAYLWNKKKNGMEIKQIQGMDELIKPSSNGSLGGEELESHPYQSLVKSTKVHYGERPDLKSK